MGVRKPACSGPIVGAKSTASAPERCHPRGSKEWMSWLPLTSTPNGGLGVAVGVGRSAGFSPCRMT